MELIVMITTLSLFLSILLTPSVSLLLDPNKSSSPLQEENDVKPYVVALPRKLKLTEDEIFESTQKERLTGRLYHKEEEEVLKPGEGTIQGRQALDATDLLTMDYSKARKRRPIHNQSFPAARPRP